MNSRWFEIIKLNMVAKSPQIAVYFLKLSITKYKLSADNLRPIYYKNTSFLASALNLCAELFFATLVT